MNKDLDSVIIEDGGVVHVSDGSVTYRGELTGEWTLGQLARAFSYGYDSASLDDGETIDCTVSLDDDGSEGEMVAEFDLIANGEGGVKRVKFAMPHEVDWK